MQWSGVHYGLLFVQFVCSRSICCVCVFILALNGNTPKENGFTEQRESKRDTNATLASFATLPRAPKKLSTNCATFADLNAHKQRPPSKSIPDLLKLAPQTPFVRTASPKLHRVNACKIKRGSTRSTADDEIDESCIEVVNEEGEFHWIALQIAKFLCL